MLGWSNLLIVILLLSSSTAFYKSRGYERSHQYLRSNENNEDTPKRDSLAFLRMKGRVGGNILQPILGVDEGTAGGVKRSASIRKSRESFISCEKSGVIDNMSEPFPVTSSGTEWKGVSDKIVGGNSFGSLSREEFEGRTCNVLRGDCYEGEFVQVALSLSLEGELNGLVNGGKFHGIKFDVFAKEKDDEKWQLRIKNKDCVRQFSNYLGEFVVEGKKGWQEIKIGWEELVGSGPGAEVKPCDVTTLRRMAICCNERRIGVEMAYCGVEFY